MLTDKRIQCVCVTSPYACQLSKNAQLYIYALYVFTVFQVRAQDCGDGGGVSSVRIINATLTYIIVVEHEHILLVFVVEYLIQT